MDICIIQIGDHFAQVATDNESFKEWIHHHFKVIRQQFRDTEPDIHIQISEGYGVPFQDFDVKIRQEGDRIYYERADFLLETLTTYREAKLQAYDDIALKHGLMTLYSAFIVHHHWGLLIHSSCVVSNEKAFLFAGPSGAGKSTVASLSKPREILSDEATLVRVEPDGIVAYDSPFRSDSITDYDKKSRKLEGIHLLEQSLQIERTLIPPSETVMNLMDKIFYWAHTPEDTLKVIGMCGSIARQVPAYRLKFQKNDLFWERIS